MTAYIDPVTRIADLEARLALAEIRNAHLEQVRGDLTHQLAERTRQATTDPLTGLLNRRGLEEQWWAVPASYRLAFLDLDRFKQINDRYRHDVGDLVLVTVAESLASCYPIVARYGGDELVVAGRLLGGPPRLWRVPLPDGGELTVTATVGLTDVVCGDLPETQRRADVAMYRAKRGAAGSMVLWRADCDMPPAEGRPAERLRDTRSAA